MFDIRREDGKPVVAHLLSLSPLRRIVKDYYTICDSYYQAIRTATPDKIEAIDMGRRGIHNEGSRILMERLKGKVTLDHRHRAPAVHADLRAALEGLKLDDCRPSAAARPQAVLFACGMNAVRSPMAAALLQQMFGKRDLCRLGRRAEGRARSLRGRRHGGDRHRHLAPQADHLRGARRSRGAQLRSDRHAVAAGAPQGAGADAHASPRDVEYWPTPTRPRSKATASSGSTPIARVRDQLLAQIRARFGPAGGGNE